MYVLHWVIAIFTLYCISVEACPENDTCKIDVKDKNIQALLAGMEKFTDNLLRGVYTDDYVKGNIALSPLSIYFSLALILFGSTDRTLTLLNEALGFPMDTDWQILKNDLTAIMNTLEVTRSETVNSKKIVYENVFLGQALFLQNGFQIQSPYEQFLQMIGAQYYYVDFEAPQQAVEIIKNWVATQTSKNVNVGVDKPFPTTSRILLASTVFFTAQWDDNLFPENNHSVGQFYSLYKNKIVDIGTMSTTSAKSLQYLEAPGYYTCIQLPYRGGDNTMLIVLPHKDYAIWNFVKQFGMNEYDYIIKNSAVTKANVTIPKFIGVWSSTFARYLINLGLKEIFEYAQLGNMIKDFQGGLEVAELLHAAAMELNEAGTTVSTISTNDSIYGVSLMASMTAEPVEIPIDFTVDRPFLMYIHNIQTGLPIFAALMRDL